MFKFVVVKKNDENLTMAACQHLLACHQLTFHSEHLATKATYFWCSALKYLYFEAAVAVERRHRVSG